MTIALSELHRAIGRVVYEWTHLETAVRLLVFGLSAVKSRNLYEDEGVGQVAIAVSSNIELRAAVAICKTLAHGIEEPRNYFSRLERTLNHITNELRNKRNRFVHDRWVILHDKIARYQEGSTFPKEPSTGETMMVHARVEEYLAISDIEAVADEIAQALIEVRALRAEARLIYLQKFPREELQ